MRKSSEEVNPKMDLKKEGATPEADQQERAPANMPQVGTFPTGKKAAKKVKIGQG